MERVQLAHLHVDRRCGERFWVKYHFKTDQGVEIFTQHEGDQMAAADTTTTSAICIDHIEAGSFRAGR